MQKRRKHHHTKDSPSQRQLRVAEAIRSVLATALLQESFYGSPLEGVSITVSEVRISPDLKNATAYVVALGGNAPEDFVDILNHHVSKFRYALGQEINLRYTPMLLFRRDESFEQAKKIHDILENI